MPQGGGAASGGRTLALTVVWYACSRFDPAKATLNSRYMQRRIRSLKVLPNGDLVCQPKPLMFSPVRKHPTTVDLCRPVGIDGYRRTLLLPPSVRGGCGRAVSASPLPGSDTHSFAVAQASQAGRDAITSLCTHVGVDVEHDREVR